MMERIDLDEEKKWRVADLDPSDKHAKLGNKSSELTSHGSDTL
jgi:hypothetical protein